MNTMTLTVALREIKTLKARLAKSADFAIRNVAYPSALVDPHAPSGGSVKVVRETRQSIRDMQERVVLLRDKINEANSRETLTVGGETRTITQWLIWKREVAPEVARLLHGLQTGIEEARRQSSPRTRTEPATRIDVTTAVNEQELAEEIDRFDTLFGALDGALAQANSTVTIEV